MTAMSHIHRTLAAFSAGLASLLACTAAHAQCPPEGWLPGEGYCGADGSVYAMTMWDPDGDGPQTPKVIVGGRFSYMCTAIAMNVAMYDPDTNTWSAMGAGLGDASAGNQILNFAVLPNGRLIAVGKFRTADGATAGSVARWTGSQWIPLGSGVQANGDWADVKAAVGLANGDVVVGGNFNSAGGVPAVGIARWDGDAWSPFGGGVAGGTNTRVEELDVLPNGDLIAGGEFLSAGGVPARYIALWNGTSWSAIGTGRNATVTAMKALPNGNIAVSGVNPGLPESPTVLWDGSAWTPLGSLTFDTFVRLPNGDLIGGRPGSINRWTGSLWAQIAVCNSTVSSVTELPNGDLMAGGTFTTFEGQTVGGIARKQGSAWKALCGGTNRAINSFAVLPNGDVVASGSFTHIGSTSADHLARWDGSSWHPMGPQVYQTSEYGGRVCVMPNGDVIATRYPLVINGNRNLRLARWDGQLWRSVGEAYQAGSIAPLPNGDLIAARVSAPSSPAFGLKRWDGQTWHDMYIRLLPEYPDYPVYCGIYSVLGLPNGDIVIGGDFTNSPQMRGIARWNGFSWQPMGSGIAVTPFSSTSGVTTLRLLRDGVRIVAGGGFTGGIAMWNGQAWLPMGSGLGGPVSDVCELPNGDIVATGSLAVPGVTSTQGVARWDGTQWHPVGSALAGNFSASLRGAALAALPSGDFFVGGEFITAGSHLSVNLARYAAPITRCTADLDDGSASGVRDCAVTIDDLLFFLTAFEAGDLAVDLDNGTFTGIHDGAVTIDDMLYFLVHFEGGC